MKQCHVYDGGGEGSKANTISHGKESAEVEWAFSLVSSNVEMEIGVDDTGDVVLLARCIEEVAGEYGKCFGPIHIEPIAEWGQNIHHKQESGGHVGRGEPWACKWASEV